MQEIRGPGFKKHLIFKIAVRGYSDHLCCLAYVENNLLLSMHLSPATKLIRFFLRPLCCVHFWSTTWKSHCNLNTLEWIKEKWYPLLHSCYSLLCNKTITNVVKILTVKFYTNSLVHSLHLYDSWRKNSGI